MNLVLNRIAQNKIYREDVERGVKNKRKSLLDFFSVKKMKKKTVYKEKANKEPLKFLTLKPKKSELIARISQLKDIYKWDF